MHNKYSFKTITIAEPNDGFRLYVHKGSKGDSSLSATCEFKRFTICYDKTGSTSTIRGSVREYLDFLCEKDINPREIVLHLQLALPNLVSSEEFPPPEEFQQIFSECAQRVKNSPDNRSRFVSPEHRGRHWAKLLESTVREDLAERALGIGGRED